MPSGMGGMTTGSDTRMYNPRSESSRMYSADESRGDYRHGQGDPEDMERQRDKKQAQEEAEKIKDLPHIKIEVEHQGPGLQEPLPPLPGAENEEPQMNEDENAVGAEVSQLTGMPGSMGAQLDQAVGARTGTGSAMGGYRPMLATGEPMENAWSTLLKRAKPWSTPQFDQTPVVRHPERASLTMSQIKPRNLSTYGGKGGLDEAKSPLKRTHQGRGQAHAAHEFVAPYHQYLSTQAHRRQMGGIGLPGHGAKEVGRGSPKITLHRLAGENKGTGSVMQKPKQMAVSSVPKVPMAFKAELEQIQDLLLKAKSPADYLHFSQLRSMLRRVKDLMEQKESRLKATANMKGGPGEAGHRDGGTTTNHGGTENLSPEDDTKNWGASSAHLVARGSGRSA